MTNIQPTANRQQPTRSGILLIALGAPEYGQMAANLAASIRYADPDVPIHLVYTERAVSQLTAMHRALFTSMAECPVECYTRRQATDHGRQTIQSQPPGSGLPTPLTGQAGPLPANGRQSVVHGPSSVVCGPSSIEYIKAKTHIYELTPFDETLFLDVDMYILPATRMSTVLAQLSSICDYTIENRGYADLSLPPDKLDPHYSTWVNILDVKKHYHTTGRFYHLHSEFIFFKKNAENKKFFDKVREVYDTRPIPWTVFDGAVPDEYAYDIATCITGHYPHQDPYIAIYWHGMDGRKDWNKDVIRHYIGFSLGGNFTPDWIASKVSAYKQLYRKSLRLPHLFNVAPKRRWNARRREM